MCDVEIRRARADDLPALIQALGQKAYFTNRLARPTDDGALLTAWLGSQAVGDVYLRLEPAEERKIRRHLPDVPLLTHLEVVADQRGRGIGTLLIDETENLARQAGRNRIALAVHPTNSAAARLYRRLGYTEWEHDLVKCFARLDSGGRRTLRPEWCRVLVKSLNERRPSTQLATHP